MLDCSNDLVYLIISVGLINVLLCIDQQVIFYIPHEATLPPIHVNYVYTKKQKIKLLSILYVYKWIKIEENERRYTWRGNFTSPKRRVTITCHPIVILRSKHETGSFHTTLSLETNKKQGSSHPSNQTKNRIIPSLKTGTGPFHPSIFLNQTHA